jgi:hypothetical protein
LIPLLDRKDDRHTAQINVSYQGCPTGEVTLWFSSHEAGIDMLKGGMLLPADGVDDARWVPAHRITGARLMGTADPDKVRAASAAYDRDNPRC